ncbi:MAG TPA: phasin family protein, partial [Burkholderiales bacterium]|nr:phasin family protein [Burkholderiales bacterium]
RSGMKTAAEFARTSLENTVRLQQKQLDMMRNILDESSRSTDRLGQARSIEELVGMQSQLAGTQLQRIAEFWTSAWQIAAENQKAVIEQWQSQIGRTSEAMRETTRGSEDTAQVAAQQISRASGSPHRKSA